MCRTRLNHLDGWRSQPVPPDRTLPKSNDCDHLEEEPLNKRIGVRAWRAEAGAMARGLIARERSVIERRIHALG
jgi:hypothetical protein